MAGRLLSYGLVDLDGDGKEELVLAVRNPAGERELHVHARGGERFAPEARQTIPILADVIAWGAAELRAEPGRELVLLTRSGAWSYSPTLPGYRDNARALARLELVYDVPDPRALGLWRYVLPAPGGDLVLLPGRDGFSIWGPGEGGEYESRATFPAVGVRDDAPSDHPRSQSGVGIRVEGSSSPFLAAGREQGAGGALVADALAYRAPALVDLDGDGFLDLVLARARSLTIHRGGPRGPASEPTRLETLPTDLVEDDDHTIELQLVDVDGDGLLDLLAHAWEDADGFENSAHRIALYRGQRERLIGAEPDQVLRFEAAVMTVAVADVDGDRHPDLVLRELELPSLVGTVTGLSFTFTHLVFLGEGRGFARRPALKAVETYDEETVVALAAQRELSHDCDGDGIADLVEIDLDGNVAIRRLQRSSSLLRGESWSLEKTPWKRFARGGAITSLAVRDLNGDGLGDVLSAGEQRMTVLMSSRSGGSR